MHKHSQKRRCRQTHYTYSAKLWRSEGSNPAEIRKLRFTGGGHISRTSWGCLERVYASFSSSWTLNLRFRSWWPDWNRQAICHGMGRLALTGRKQRWVCGNECQCSCLQAGKVMCSVRSMYFILQRKEMHLHVISSCKCWLWPYSHRTIITDVITSTCLWICAVHTHGMSKVCILDEFTHITPPDMMSRLCVTLTFQKRSICCSAATLII